MLNLLVKLKSILYKNEKISFFLAYFHNVFIGLNKFKINKKFNKLNHSKSLMKKSFVSVNGKNNTIEFEKFSYFENLKITINGNDNTISIGDFCYAKNLSITIEDNNNSIKIGKKTSIHGDTILSSIEGTSIEIGEDCMFSSNVDIRTGDSHSITDMDGNRINSSRNIQIGNHVWLGTRTLILKGTIISNDSIVGAASVINKHFLEPNIIIAGQPGKIVRKGVNWARERL